MRLLKSSAARVLAAATALATNFNRLLGIEPGAFGHARSQTTDTPAELRAARDLREHRAFTAARLADAHPAGMSRQQRRRELIRWTRENAPSQVALDRAKMEERSAAVQAARQAKRMAGYV